MGASANEELQLIPISLVMQLAVFGKAAVDNIAVSCVDRIPEKKD